MKTLQPRLLVPFVLLAAFAVAFGCATNPVTGKKEISLVSESQEIAAGKESEAAIAAEFGVYDDAAWRARIDSLGQAMARRSHRPDLPWAFHVLDDPTVNAFAAPGGFIYVTRGILAHLGSEAQLAGVVGHEIGHVTARHYASAASREQLAGLGLVIGSVMSETIARYGQVAQQGLGLLFLKYGRDQENESDRLGVDYSFAAGYDPREMPATYRTLARIGERAGARIPTYLSTHPDPAAREVTVRALAAAKVGTRTGLIVGRDPFVRRLDGIVYGDDPRQGYFEGTRFFHPGLAFTMDFPSGWTTQNGRRAVMAADEKQDAIMQVSLVDAGTLSPAAFVQKLLADRAITRADGSAETIGGFAAWSGRFGVTDDQDRPATLAVVLLRRSPSAMFRMLAQVTPGSPADDAFFAACRSFRALTDPARLAPEPARLRIVAAPRSGTLGQLVAGLGSQAIGPEEAALLNGVEVDTPIEAGRLLKIVRPAKRN